MKFKMSLLTIIVALGTGFTALAEETVAEKVESKVDEVKTDTKINARNAKRSVRNATCTDARKAAGKCGVVEDAKDSARNAGDAISHEAKKLKNKVD